MSNQNYYLSKKKQNLELASAKNYYKNVLFFTDKELTNTITLEDYLVENQGLNLNDEQKKLIKGLNLLYRLYDEYMKKKNTNNTNNKQNMIKFDFCKTKNNWGWQEDIKNFACTRNIYTGFLSKSAKDCIILSKKWINKIKSIKKLYDTRRNVDAMIVKYLKETKQFKEIEVSGGKKNNKLNNKVKIEKLKLKNKNEVEKMKNKQKKEIISLKNKQKKELNKLKNM